MLKNKLQILFKVSRLLDRKEKAKITLIFALTLISSLFQIIGIASIIPFTQIVLNPEVVYTNGQLNYFFNLLNFTNPNSFLIFIGVILIIFIILSNAITAITDWLKISFTWKKKHSLSVSLLNNYLHRPYVYFLKQNSANLNKNILAEVNDFVNNLLYPLLQILTDLFIVFAISILMIVVNPPVTITTILILSFVYLIMYLKLSGNVRRDGAEVVKQNRGRFKAVNESLGSVKDIKSLGREKYFLGIFQDCSNKFSCIQIKHQLKMSLPRYFVEAIVFSLAVSLMVVFINFGYAQEEIIPLLAFFVFAGYKMLPFLQSIFRSLTSLNFNEVVLDKIYNDLQYEDMVDEPTSDRKVQFKDEICLNNISFNYPNSEKQILKKINLKICRDQKIAIVGETGSGKTTLVDIILGLLTPSRGAITADGQSLTGQNLCSWKKNIGYVPQQIFLTDDTVANNIAFGLPEHLVNMDRIKEVAKTAQIDEFIEKSLPKGYQTIIGERGIRLSGGQRQRLGIARAIYHDPQILIFDEATNSLDNLTEQKILQTINDVSKNKTIITITHNLKTIENCDKIYSLQNGEIANLKEI